MGVLYLCMKIRTLATSVGYSILKVKYEEKSNAKASGKSDAVAIALLSMKKKYLLALNKLVPVDRELCLQIIKRKRNKML